MAHSKNRKPQNLLFLIIISSPSYFSKSHFKITNSSFIIQKLVIVPLKATQARFF